MRSERLFHFNQRFQIFDICSLIHFIRTLNNVPIHQMDRQLALDSILILIHVPNDYGKSILMKNLSARNFRAHFLLPRITFWSSSRYRNYNWSCLSFGYSYRVLWIAFRTSRRNGNVCWCCLLYLFSVRWTCTISGSWSGRWWIYDWIRNRLLRKLCQLYSSKCGCSDKNGVLKYLAWLSIKI